MDIVIIVLAVIGGLVVIGFIVSIFQHIFIPNKELPEAELNELCREIQELKKEVDDDKDWVENFKQLIEENEDELLVLSAEVVSFEAKIEFDIERKYKEINFLYTERRSPA